MDARVPTLRDLIANIERVIVGKRQPIELALITLLCRGHLLIEDVPGLGKTMLARALAGSLALDTKRIQCTPDLLPSDVTGVSIFNQKTQTFEFQPGPVFTNILLADEVNRTTPRTQSALLECMAEFQVTVDGETRRLPELFMVIATQNPIELEGTYPLPEAQLDRFFMRISMGYPAPEQEARIMEMQMQGHPIQAIEPVMTETQLLSLRQQVQQIHIEPTLLRYIAQLMEATRRHPKVLLGASPRGSLALMRAAQAAALLQGQDYVEPLMIQTMCRPVLTHRILLKPEARLEGLQPEAVLDEVLGQVTVPVG